MASITDIIEKFILNVIGDDEEVNISRNELAEYFSCAPSQINYVLQTRFNLDNGFGFSSRRGNGGYVRVYKIKFNDQNYINEVLTNIVSDEMSYKRICNIVNKLEEEEIVSNEVAKIIKSAVSDNAIRVPLQIKDSLRSSIFKEILMCILENEDSKDDKDV